MWTMGVVSDVGCFFSVILVYTLCYHNIAVCANSHISDTNPAASAIVNICSLPDADRAATSGGCNFNTGTCGYQVPAALWQPHNESAGTVMFGTISDETPNNVNPGLQTFVQFTTSDASIPTGTSASIVNTPVTVKNTCLRFWYLMPNQNSRLGVYLRYTDDTAGRLLWQQEHVLTSMWTKVSLSLQENASFEVEFKSTKENLYAYVGLDSVLFQIEKAKPVTTTQPLPNLITTTTTKLTTAIQTTTTTQPRTIKPTNTTTTSTTTPETTTTTTTIVPTTACQCPPCPTHTQLVACTNGPASTGTAEPRVPRICAMLSAQTRMLNTSCTFDGGLCGYDLPIYPHIWELASYRYGNGIDGHHSNEKHLHTPHKRIRRVRRETGYGGCNCSCPTPVHIQPCTGTSTTPTPTTPSTLQCSNNEFPHTLASPSCNFDSGACGWNIPMYPHLWELTRYRHGNGYIGVIDGDHSQDGDGMYIVFSTDNLHVQPGSRDEMTSPMLTSSRAICISFWRNMPTQSSLLIVQKRTKQFGDSTLAVFKGSRTNGWEPVSVIAASTYPFQIVFSSIKSDVGSYVGIDDSYVGIDDIYVRHE